MTITIHNTTKIIEVNNHLQCRVWEGETASGIKVQCLIPRIAVLAAEDLCEFEAELEEQAAPTEQVSMFPARLIL